MFYEQAQHFPSTAPCAVALLASHAHGAILEFALLNVCSSHTKLCSPKKENSSLITCEYKENTILCSVDNRILVNCVCYKMQ